jgi:hypothetical protein
LRIGGVRGIIFHIPGEHHVLGAGSSISEKGVLIPSQFAQIAGTGIARLVVPVALDADERLGMDGIKNRHPNMRRRGREGIGGAINRLGERQGDVGRRCPVGIVIGTNDPHTF